METSFLFTADCHIKKRTWVNHIQPEGDSYEALRKINRQLQDLKQPTETLVIGGDFFDSNRPTSTDEMEAIRFLSGFKRVLYIRGNHDNVNPSYLEALLNKLTGVELVELTTTGHILPDGMGGSVEFYGISWMSSRDDLLETLQQIPESNGSQYVVLHTAFRHLLEIGSWTIERKDIENIFAGRNVRILVGDIHTRDTLELSGMSGYIHSPGSVYPTSWPKPEETYAASLISYKTGEITSVDCTVRDYISIPFEDDATLKAVISDTKGHHELPPVIRLEVPSDATYRINPVDYPEAVILCQKGVSGQSMGGVQALPSSGISQEEAIVQEAGSPDMAKLATELFRSDDPLATLGEWLDFWKVERIVP